MTRRTGTSRGDEVEADTHRQLRRGGAVGYDPGAPDFFTQPAPIPATDPIHGALRRFDNERSRARREDRKTIADGVLAILEKLPAESCLSRDEIIARFGTRPDGTPRLTVNAACGCLNALVLAGDLEAVDAGAVSNAGNKVTGYRLTAIARQRRGAP